MVQKSLPLALRLPLVFEKLQASQDTGGRTSAGPGPSKTKILLLHSCHQKNQEHVTIIHISNPCYDYLSHHPQIQQPFCYLLLGSFQKTKTLLIKGKKHMMPIEVLISQTRNILNEHYHITRFVCAEIIGNQYTLAGVHTYVCYFGESEFLLSVLRCCTEIKARHEDGVLWRTHTV